MDKPFHTKISFGGNEKLPFGKFAKKLFATESMNGGLQIKHIHVGECEGDILPWVNVPYVNCPSLTRRMEFLNLESRLFAAYRAHADELEYQQAGEIFLRNMIPQNDKDDRDD